MIKKWYGRSLLPLIMAISIIAMVVVPVFAVDSIILGNDGAGGSNSGANYVTYTRSQAAANSVAHSIRIDTNVNGNTKIALYSGNSTQPITKLQSTSGACTAGGYNTFTIADTNIVSGTYYWIGCISDTAGVSTYNAGGSTRKYLGTAYAGYTFPDTWSGAGYTDDTVSEFVAVMGVSATAPSVTTYSASSITSTSAVIGGNVTASVPLVTKYGTQYGMSTAYGSWINSTVSQSAPISFTNTTAALTQGKGYYFRAFAENFVGIGYGSQTTFLTLPDPPTAFTCTSLNTTAVTLNWTVGSGYLYTPIWYKTTGYPAAPADGTLACNTTTNSAVIAGLDNTLTYYFSAWSWTSNSTVSATAYSDTWAQATGAPFGVASLTTLPCSGFTSSSAILNGQLNSSIDPVLEYGFEYGVTTGYGTSTTVTGSLAAGTKYWANAINLNAGSIYHYRAKARTMAGWGYGNDVVFATKGSPVAWEYWNTGGDSDSAPTYYANMTAMQFTVGATSHTVTSIRIPLKKTGTTPGTARLSLYHADGAFKPTGNEIAYGTLDANYVSSAAYAWYSFTLNAETDIQAGQMYSLVLKLQGDSANYITWQVDSGGGIANAVYSYSVDSGITWTVDAPKDALFEVWGNPSISILDAKVFQNYATTGDWLVCAETQNTYLPYYPNADAGLYFTVQLINGSTVVASTPLHEFGRRPIAILLNKATADTLTWGSSSLKVRITLNSSATQYSEYALVASDWQAGGNTYVDNWVRYTAVDIQSYDSTILGATQSYIVQTNNGRQLTNNGGQIYITGVPLIMSIRPNLFQIQSTTLTHTANTATDTWSASHVVSDKIGSELYGTATVVGNIFGMDGKNLIAALVWIAWIIMVGLMFKVGTGVWGLIVGIPILVGGWYIGAIDIAFMLTVNIICVI
ncbi:MAG: hypothetical protein WC499_04810, partial [Patescibacteria group bacterium]